MHPQSPRAILFLDRHIVYRLGYEARLLLWWREVVGRSSWCSDFGRLVVVVSLGLAWRQLVFYAMQGLCLWYSGGRNPMLCDKAGFRFACLLADELACLSQRPWALIGLSRELARSVPRRRPISAWLVHALDPGFLDSLGLCSCFRVRNGHLDEDLLR